jgi:signal transduction histidine kinase
MRDGAGVWSKVPLRVEVPGVPSLAAFALAQTADAQGRKTLWIGSDEAGLLLLRDGKLGRLGVERGIASPIVVDLLATPVGRGGSAGSRLWFATGGAGAGWIDPDDPLLAVHRLDDRTSPALPNNSLYALVRDDRGRVYVTSNAGVTRIDAAAGGDPLARPLRVFGTRDGLPSQEGNQGAAYVDRRGRVWVGTVRGVAVLDPALEVEDHEPKPIRFVRASVDGSDRPLGPGLTLRHADRSLRIEYALATPVRADEATFRTQLLGFDPEPLPATHAVAREFTALRPGRYRFRVWGRDLLGNEAGPIEIAVTSRPAPWASWPAIALYVALAAVALRGAHLFRLGQVRRRLAVVVAERNRMARELHDTVLQNLAGISMQLDDAAWKAQERPAELASAISRSRELVESAHAEVRRSVWGLRSGALEDQELPAALLAQAQQLAAGTGTEVRLDVQGEPRRLPAEQELELLRIGQEATSNALRHGRARTVTFELRYEPARLRLAVRDDGGGFAPSLAERADGFGMRGMRERAAGLGARLEIHSQPGSGSAVELELPLAPAPPAQVAS